MIENGELKENGRETGKNSGGIDFKVLSIAAPSSIPSAFDVCACELSF